MEIEELRKIVLENEDDILFILYEKAVDELAKAREAAVRAQGDLDLLSALERVLSARLKRLRAEGAVTPTPADDDRPKSIFVAL